jgi:hypothetical protein
LSECHRGSDRGEQDGADMLDPDVPRSAGQR